jgi:hypothetical protein
MGIGRRSFLKLIASGVVIFTTSGSWRRYEKIFRSRHPWQESVMRYPGNIIPLKRRMIQRQSPWAG